MKKHIDLTSKDRGFLTKNQEDDCNDTSPASLRRRVLFDRSNLLYKKADCPDQQEQMVFHAKYRMDGRNDNSLVSLRGRVLFDRSNPLLLKAIHTLWAIVLRDFLVGLL